MDATSLVKKRFNELATRAQEAGVKLAAQVKDQQHRLANRNSSKVQGARMVCASEGSVVVCHWLSDNDTGWCLLSRLWNHKDNNDY